MKAIFIIKNNQYLANTGDTINVKKIDYKIGNIIFFKKVLAISTKKKIMIGKPFLDKEYVEAIIKSHKKSKKIHIIKHKRRKHYKKKQGHRQEYTVIKITKISNNNRT
ncbi:50S ribosomal protein L21 [Buchnera aphidicola (Chaitoregma tattakana)]|uniref:50S ribosomal protein L21 n=1 Tax=Buchnera aphidicola TaxID=9 RepID=UPI0031B84F1B